MWVIDIVFLPGESENNIDLLPVIMYVLRTYYVRQYTLNYIMGIELRFVYHRLFQV